MSYNEGGKSFITHFGEEFTILMTESLTLEEDKYYCHILQLIHAQQNKLIFHMIGVVNIS